MKGTDFQEKTVEGGSDQNLRGNKKGWDGASARSGNNSRKKNPCKNRWEWDYTKTVLLRPLSPLGPVRLKQMCTQLADQLFVNTGCYNDQYASPFYCETSNYTSSPHIFLIHSDQLSTTTKHICFWRDLSIYSADVRDRTGGSCWNSLAAAFARDPSGQPRNAAAALIASLCTVLFVDFHLPANAAGKVNAAWECKIKKITVERTI